ncbi:uncharacterized protein L201_005889 [Kwoniella dendrophila CBS 6074]|uniref:Uncharacterized protein n=1 Tax=Kwoniella dendrophila CBS 6074 TaxID=1295534 RepID=A0AAX4K085_9TREE
MTSVPTCTRRRPLSVSVIHEAHLEPALPEPIPCPITPLVTSYRSNLSRGLGLGHHQDEYTPSPLKELEKRWKETRRRRMGNGESDNNVKNRFIKHNVHEIDEPTRRNNVRFASSSSALLTPPSTPPRSPQLSAKETQYEQAVLHSAKPNRGKKGNTAPAYPAIPPDLQSVSPQAFHPITSSPLPPTVKPVPILKAKEDTIYVHSPASSYELTLNLAVGQVIRVRKGGMVIELTSGTGREKARILRLRDFENWSKYEKRDWENVSGVVEGFKRITPRVKLYHPLGHLIMTCSSPPDIIISFRLGFETPRSSPRNLKYNQQNGHKMTMRRQGYSRVKVIYSRSKSEMKVDTICKDTSHHSKESLKTQRLIKLSPHNQQENLDKGEGLSSLEELAVELGFQTDFQDWKEEENEGLRRLWFLRDEWGRWDNG